MSTVDVVDETFLAVPPTRVAAEFADPAGWRRFWPDLQLSVVIDRGPKGVRWTVAGALVGSMEVWLEPVLDGTVLHYYLRADPSDPNGRPAPLPPRRAGAEISRRQRAAKAIALWLKDELEEGRPPGVAPVPLPSASTAPVEPAPSASLSAAPAPPLSGPGAPRPSEQGHPSPGTTPGAGTTVSP
ncbi:MAG: hypothetical protein QOG76_5056 [Pseudonocardiales bacterium]|nr:hypothetical protein [Pseudonocardiales bacterium]